MDHIIWWSINYIVVYNFGLHSQCPTGGTCWTSRGALECGHSCARAGSQFREPQKKCFIWSSNKVVFHAPKNANNSKVIQMFLNLFKCLAKIQSDQFTRALPVSTLWVVGFLDQCKGDALAVSVPKPHWSILVGEGGRKGLPVRGLWDITSNVYMHM